MNLWHTLFFCKVIDKILRFLVQLYAMQLYAMQLYAMQLVTPREAAIAVKIDSTIWNTVFQVSFFIRSFFSD